MIRKQFLLSAGTICLMLASGLAYAQTPPDLKRGETKGDRVEKSEPAKGAESRSPAPQQERTRDRAGAANEPQTPSAPSRQAGEERGRSPATAAERANSPKPEEQNRARNESSKPDSRQDEHADQSRHGNRADENKASSAGKTEPAPANRSAQEQEKPKAGAPSTGTAQNQRGETARNPDVQSQPSSTTQNNAPANPPAATNNTANNSRTSTETQRGADGGSQTNTSAAASAGKPADDKQVRISETLSRQQMAPPEHNLNVSISVGTEIPNRVRVHRLPAEIVSIEPEYRDYEYFTTDDDIVIVEPRSHRVVNTIPKDVSRARAEVRGGAAPVNVAGNGAGNVAGNNAGAGPCQIMRRDTSGQLSDASSTTVGSAGQSGGSIVVTVRTPDQRTTQPITLDAPAGQIVVATQGQGDCQVTIEPQSQR